ncbi:MAG: type II toxin-antitoxin system HicA family toxin [Pseudomonadota bacterium]
MTRLPTLTPRNMIRVLERNGFYLHRSKGSHGIYKHRDDPSLRVVVPYHGTDLAPGTLRSIIKDAGFTVEEFLKLL